MTQVFDSSAVLAAIFDEQGGDRVAKLWSQGENLLSTINYAEVIAKLAERGMPDEHIRVVMEGVPLVLAPFDEQVAHSAGLLRRSTKSLGLALGDRACIALAMVHDAPAVTADTVWKDLQGIKVLPIR